MAFGVIFKSINTFFFNFSVLSLFIIFRNLWVRKCVNVKILIFISWHSFWVKSYVIYVLDTWLLYSIDSLQVSCLVNCYLRSDISHCQYFKYVDIFTMLVSVRSAMHQISDITVCMIFLECNSVPPTFLYESRENHAKKNAEVWLRLQHSFCDKLWDMLSLYLIITPYCKAFHSIVINYKLKNWNKIIELSN